ncbi:hypothetical protein EWM64_g8084 [Hericium alpestre]|uniref:Uncharacterized protein n=1 Tax=Hericium alpestre TaxID=135208 RepID=A0A4Y9ZPE8_9AGAM|nr:hypothetical protein EWM64_g8084 [Hericium alpestre]
MRADYLRHALAIAVIGVVVIGVVVVVIGVVVVDTESLLTVGGTGLIKEL